MTQDQFIKLNFEDKTEFLWKYAELVSEKAYYECNITLFLLDSFYVEVFYNRVLNEIVGVEIQGNDQILYEYVKDLNLDEIVKLLH